MCKKVPQVRISCSPAVSLCMSPFPSCLFLDTGKTKFLHVSNSNLTGASTISQTLSLGPPFLFAACATFVLQLDLYKHKGQVTGNCCSHFPPLCLIATNYTFLSGRLHVWNHPTSATTSRHFCDTTKSMIPFPFVIWQLEVERMCTLPFQNSADIRKCDSFMFSLSY